MSFENLDIDFSNYSGFTLVSGQNNFKLDNSSSNGVGKSSIEEAIVWSLTGETLRGTKDVKRFGCEDACSVDIEFTIDNDNYRIIRSKDKTNLQLFINNEDVSGKGIRDTEKILQERLPDLTKSLIGSVIILGQGLPQRLSNNTPSGRKEVLEQLSKSDFMIEDLKKRISNRKNHLLQENRKLEDNILKLNTELELKTQQLKQLSDKLLNLKSSDELQNLVKELNGRKLKDQKDVSALNDIIQILTERKNQTLAASRKREDKFSKDSLALQTEYIQKRNQKYSKYLNLKYQIDQLTTSIKEKESIADVCPTCGQKLLGVTKPDTSSDRLQAAELQKEFDQLDIYLNSIENEYDIAYSELSKIKNKDIAKIESGDLDLRNELDSYKEKLDFINQDLLQTEFELTKNSSELLLLENTKNQLNQDIDQITKELQAIESNLLYNNNDSDEFKKHIEVINKMETSIKRDFRGYLLSNIILYINHKCKEYAINIFNNDNVEFKLDGNNISISYNNKEYENLSGGERQKIDLIVQLAIRSMLCTYLNFSCNILILDEITDNLDGVGCQNIINFITNELLDIENIFIISHHQDIQLPYDNEILVMKNEDGVSEIL